MELELHDEEEESDEDELEDGKNDEVDLDK